MRFTKLFAATPTALRPTVLAGATFLLGSLTLVATSGCDNKTTLKDDGINGVAAIKADNDPSIAPSEESDHSDHQHGIHGGEITIVQPGGYPIEWVHNDDSSMTLYFDSVTEKKMTPEGVMIKVATNGKAGKTYNLKSGADSTFVSDDKELSTAVDASGKEDDKMTSTLMFKVDGKEQTGKLYDMHAH